MSTIPPLVCNTPPPIDDLDSDEDISGANGSHSEHFEDETPSPSPLPRHTHSSFSTDNFAAVEDVCQLNENSKHHNAEAPNEFVIFEQTADVVIEKPISSTDITNEIGLNEKTNGTVSSKFSVESNFSRDGSSLLLDNMGISMNLNLNLVDEPKSVTESESSSNMSNDRKPIASELEDDMDVKTNDDRRAHLGETVELDENKINDCSSNERTIDAYQIQSNETLKTMASECTVRCNEVNCDEKKFNEKFDANFTQFASFENISAITVPSEEGFPKCDPSTISSEESFSSVYYMNTDSKNSDHEDDEFGDFSSFSPTITSSSDITAVGHKAMGSLSSSKDTTDESKMLKLSEQKSIQHHYDSNEIFDSCSEITTDIEQTTHSSTKYETNVNERSHCKNIENNLASVLSTLFPNDNDHDPENDYQCVEHTTNDPLLFMSELTINLKNVDNAKALKHQWAKSAAKIFLVKSLGIDPRNILYGERWNCSAPKFAANLGMSPLEPTKLNVNTNPHLSDSDTKSPKTTVNIGGADVPAAQFDWNSSGLINPLDALHAHTLLLDLEQLVVVANLEKKKINSSSSTCIQEREDDNDCLANSVLNYPTSTTSTLKLTENDLKTVTQSTNSSSIQQNGSNYLINDEKQTKTNHLNVVYGMHSIMYQSNKQQTVMGNSNHITFDEYFRSQKSVHEENEIPLEPKQWNHECQKAQEPANHSSTMPPIIPTILSPIVPEIESAQPKKSNERNVFDLNLSHMESIQTSDSYNVPGSSGTMKETHIFTPNKPQLGTDVELGAQSAIDIKLASDDTERVVIKENVVKKEYRDIEYDPERMICLDEFSDFQFAMTTNTDSEISEHIAMERGQCQQAIELASSVAMNDNNINNKSNSANVNMTNNCHFNEFEKANAFSTHSSVMQATKMHAMHELKNENNQTKNLTRLDDSFENVQPITSQTYPNDGTSNASMMISNILKPQPISVKPIETLIKSSPNIEWPGPGIDTDQLMRLEQRFFNQPQITSQTNGNADHLTHEKCIEDDEWSDFVSVEQPQTPITNILSKNLLKQQSDEDDWSEFVSSTVPMNSHRTILNTSPNNLDSPNNSLRTPWNCTDKSVSLRANKKSSMYNVFMNQRSGYTDSSQSVAPSMISQLPDLRFVAPKSLVHISKSSLTKK